MYYYEETRATPGGLVATVVTALSESRSLSLTPPFAVSKPPLISGTTGYRIGHQFTSPIACISGGIKNARTTNVSNNTANAMNAVMMFSIGVLENNRPASAYSTKYHSSSHTGTCNNSNVNIVTVDSIQDRSSHSHSPQNAMAMMMPAAVITRPVVASPIKMAVWLS